VLVAPEEDAGGTPTLPSLLAHEKKNIGKIIPNTKTQNVLPENKRIALRHSSYYSDIAVALDKPFMSKWLTRLRKDLSRSGSLTELSFHLSKNSETSPEQWQQTIRSILEKDQKPDSYFVLAVDQWITQRGQSSSKKSSSHDDQLDLL